MYVKANHLKLYKYKAKFIVYILYFKYKRKNYSIVNFAL